MTVGELKAHLDGVNDYAKVTMGALDIELGDVTVHGPGCTGYTFGEVNLTAASKVSE